MRISEVKVRRRAPPPKRKTLPPKRNHVKAAAVKIVEEDIEIGSIAGRHQRRVTLNLIRLSKICPHKLRRVLNKLATDKHDWNLNSLKKKEVEIIFGAVDDDLADQAKDEFVADLETIRDLSRHPRPDNEECLCELCGHQNIRWEFDLINTAGGTSTTTGSICIETYGLNVDGYGTAEVALKALKAAIAKAKRVADMEEWQEEHPDHVTDFNEITTYIKLLHHSRSLAPWTLYDHVQPNWRGRAEELLKAARPALRYYRENEYLTPTRTNHVYGTPGSTGVLQGFEDQINELEAAREALVAAKAWWHDLRHWNRTQLTPQQADAIDYLERIGADPGSDTTSHDLVRDLIKRILGGE